MVPASLLSTYHRVLARSARWWYGNPSKRLTVIGVTGTHGKSSVVMLLGSVLRATGARVGWISTATMSDGAAEWYNNLKMTMPGRFFLQRFLARCVQHGCTFVVIETSSEGIAQHRHRGISYDLAVLTNLGHEHLEAHGGFARYRAVKASLFAHTARGSKPQRIAVIPKDLDAPEDFIGHPFSDVRTFSAGDSMDLHLVPSLAAFPANTAAVLAVASALHCDRGTVRETLRERAGLPGRLEALECGQPFEVIVDYAHTVEALETIYAALPKISGRTIHVLGGVGGGRDRWKRAAMGAVAAANAEIVVVTNEDPYDDNPQEIIDAVANGAHAWRDAHQQDGRTVEVIRLRDRRDGLRHALQIARAGDRVLVTGKGCEQAIVGPWGMHIPWDDRVVLRELLRLDAMESA